MINHQKLGAGMLASGPVLVTLSGSKACWWLGYGFLILGPLLMSVSRKDDRHAASANKKKKA